MSSQVELILVWAFVGFLWVLARHVGYREVFKDGYEQGEKDFRQTERSE